MGARTAKTKAGRGRGEVVPISDDDGPDSSYSPLDKPQRTEPTRGPVPQRRVFLTRGWLGFFLLLNVFAIAGFIFSSAWYFPASSTTGVVEQVLKQGDVSLLELPPRPDQRADGAVERVETTSIETISTSTQPPQPTEHPQKQSQEPSARFRRKNGSSTNEIKPSTTTTTISTTQPLTIEPEQPPSDGEVHITSEVHTTKQPASTAPPPLDSFEAQDPLETISPELTPIVSVIRSQSMEELLRRVKGTQSPSPSPKENEVTTNAARKSGGDHVQNEASTSDQSIPEQSRAEQDTPQLEPTLKVDEDLETNLVVWLQSDAGVEIVDAIECEALGTACEVTSWKSAISPRGGKEPIIFRPVDSQMPPVVQPAVQNELPMVSFSCGMAHNDGFVLHEMMTFFFVLSPTQIETGDTYSGQKFFGNAPYGQFLMHGGRPAFFTAGGLVESTATVKNDELTMVGYRLHRHAVEIKVDELEWSPKQPDGDAFQLRLSGNAALSLGNVKGVCDTNAFKGRIAEVLIYDAVLSDHQVAIVEQYLRQKWWGETQSPKTDPTADKQLKHTQWDPVEMVAEPTTGAVVATADGETPPVTDPLDSEQPEVTGKAQSKEVDLQPAAVQSKNPRVFDAEGVFEWLPSEELLALISKEQGSDPSPLVEKWKQAVNEKVASVRSFQFGSDILRSFIRERRDELLALREELFGG